MMIVFFHLIFFIGKYAIQKFFKREQTANAVKPLALKQTTNSCENDFKGLFDDQQLNKFYDDNDNAKTMKFSPPAYQQRYNSVCDILRSQKYRGKIRKVVDFGCSELGLFKHLKHIPGIYELLCVDIDEKILRMNIRHIEPLSADFLHLKEHPFNVNIYKGSITHKDESLENSDVVICIELIEHLYPETLLNVPENIFGFIKPRLAIFTTPNADFNVLFPNFKGFRHYDHKFEWSRSEFEHWATDITYKYPDYEVEFHGICPGPIGTEQFGCCTQMAVFTRREDINYEIISGVDGLFELIAKIEYPFRIDNRTLEEKILDDASYFIHKYQFVDDRDDETVPLDYLTRIMDNLEISNDSFRAILSNGGYNIVDDESRGAFIILPPSSIISDVTSEVDVTFEDWSQSSHPGEHENEANWKENVDISMDCGSVALHNETADEGSILKEQDFSQDYESIHSIFMESSRNENSLLYPDITDPNFKFSIVSRNSSPISMKDHDIITDELFPSNDDTEIRLTSTPNKKQSFALANCRSHKLDYDKDCDHRTNLIVDTPSTSWSPEIISDSGYPNTCSAPDSTPEYDLPSIAQDNESDSEPEDHNKQQPQINFHDDEVENGDLANNNRDNEGNNMIAQVENGELRDIQPFIEVFEKDLENENDIYDLQNEFPDWLLRIHGARFL